MDAAAPNVIAPFAEGTLVLSEQDVRRLEFDPQEVVAEVTAVFAAQARGDMAPVPRTVLGPQEGGRFLAFPGYLPSCNLCGLKWLSIGHVDAAGKPLPFSAHIMLSDAATGRLVALVDARWITLARTVAVTVVAARLAADPGSKSIGFIGCGEQACAHLQSLVRCFPLKTVFAVGRRPGSVAAFLDLARSLGLEASETDPRGCLDGSDIVVSAVSAHGAPAKVADEAWLRPGSFVSLVDLGRVWQSRPGGNRLLVDDRGQFGHLTRDGRLAIPGDPVEISDLIKPGAGNADRTGATIFVPTGFGAADLALAARLVRSAGDAGIGQFLRLA